EVGLLLNSTTASLVSLQTTECRFAPLGQSSASADWFIIRGAHCQARWANVYYDTEPRRRTGRSMKGGHHVAVRLCIHGRDADLRGYVPSVSCSAHRIPALAPVHRHTALAPLRVSPILVATRPVPLVLFWHPGALGVLV